MRLVELHRFMAANFEAESVPSEPTLCRWCELGKLPARKVGGRWFVDADAWAAQARQLSAVDAEVARILATPAACAVLPSGHRKRPSRKSKRNLCSATGQ